MKKVLNATFDTGWVLCYIFLAFIKLWWLLHLHAKFQTVLQPKLVQRCALTSSLCMPSFSLIGTCFMAEKAKCVEWRFKKNEGIKMKICLLISWDWFASCRLAYLGEHVWFNSNQELHRCENHHSMAGCTHYYVSWYGITKTNISKGVYSPTLLCVLLGES